jgi:predicted ATPase
MLKRLSFVNFKALRRASLPLGPLTVLAGPNGSGKSSVFQALRCLANSPKDLAAIAEEVSDLPTSVTALWTAHPHEYEATLLWSADGVSVSAQCDGQSTDPSVVHQYFSRCRFYALDPDRLAEPSGQTSELASDGFGLAGLLASFRQLDPDCFAAINRELSSWLPEFSSIELAEVSGDRFAVKLRSANRDRSIPARGLSEGVRFTLALLALSRSPHPSSLIGIEEPERGLHPRLFRELRDAFYRLAYPESGCSSDATQVIATSHSPYFLDEFREHPEEIALADKLPDGSAGFRNLGDHPQLNEILRNGSSLGDLWFSGALGAVPPGPQA